MPFSWPPVWHRRRNSCWQQDRHRSQPSAAVAGSFAEGAVDADFVAGLSAGLLKRFWPGYLWRLSPSECQPANPASVGPAAERCCARPLPRRGSSIDVHDQTVRVGQQEHGIVLDSIHFQHHSHDAGLILRDANGFQKSAAVQIDRLVQQRGSQFRSLRYRNKSGRGRRCAPPGISPAIRRRSRCACRYPRSRCGCARPAGQTRHPHRTVIGRAGLGVRRRLGVRSSAEFLYPSQSFVAVVPVGAILRLTRRTGAALDRRCPPASFSSAARELPRHATNVDATPGIPHSSFCASAGCRANLPAGSARWPAARPRGICWWDIPAVRN